jgi:choline dehydrogenase-like flavoprotein
MRAATPGTADGLFGPGEFRPFDAVVIGSGVGGAMAAHTLVEAGMRVAMIERGPRLARHAGNAAPEAALELSPYYSHESALLVRGDDSGTMGTFQCVGGPAVFYGGVALRYREDDFGRCPEIQGDAGIPWPIGYADLEPWYGAAERLFSVAGREHADDPWRSAPFPHRAPDVRGPTVEMWKAARSVGLEPRHLPLAIDFSGAAGDADGSAPCSKCGSCDGYVCPSSAKREPASALIPRLESRGMRLFPETVVTRLLKRHRRIVGVECVDRRTGRARTIRAERYVLAAGALGSPHLVQVSALHASNPARTWVGRGLMRHCNGIVFGLFPRPLDGARAFHKQMILFDFYRSSRGAPLGTIQSIHPPPPGLVADRVPQAIAGLGDWIADRSTGLLVIAEDQPRPENRVDAHSRRTDRFGVPRLVVTHRHTWRDAVARRDLGSVAGGLLRRAGAVVTQSIRIKTFSHALGTMRMGLDPARAPVDPAGRFRGLDNLWVADGSLLPRSGGVNPSLTIAANALRVAAGIAQRASRLEARGLEALP